jgi:hypothetical protein
MPSELYVLVIGVANKLKSTTEACQCPSINSCFLSGICISIDDLISQFLEFVEAFQNDFEVHSDRLQV